MDDPDQDGELDDIEVLQIHAGNADGAELVFDFNAQRIAVSVFPSSVVQDQNKSSIQDEQVRLLDRIASSEVDDDEYEELVDRVLEVILGAGRETFKATSKSLRQPHLGTDPPQDLRSVLYPSILHFQLQDVNGTATIVPTSPKDACVVPADDPGSNSAEEDELAVDPTLPCFSTREILILETYVEGSGHAASRVTADGTEMFCKAHASAGGLIGTSLARELECLQKARRLASTDSGALIRIPQILGHVRHADTGRLVGFVRQWIPGRQLRSIDVPRIPVQQRQRWIGQIRDAVHALHAGGIIWGDGKASNVVIDEGDDAWLIDFGGGWTDGWVDEVLADTVEGDKQAIRKIAEFLKVVPEP